MVGIIPPNPSGFGLDFKSGIKMSRSWIWYPKLGFGRPNPGFGSPNPGFGYSGRMALGPGPWAWPMAPGVVLACLASDFPRFRPPELIMTLYPVDQPCAPLAYSDPYSKTNRR